MLLLCCLGKRFSHFVKKKETIITLSAIAISELSWKGRNGSSNEISRFHEFFPQAQEQIDHKMVGSALFEKRWMISLARYLLLRLKKCRFLFYFHLVIICDADNFASSFSKYIDYYSVVGNLFLNWISQVGNRYLIHISW